MNPSLTVGTRRDPLGISAWRSIAHRIICRVESPFIRCWFKNRLPPSPTSQVGFQNWMLGNLSKMRKRGAANSWHLTCQQKSRRAKAKDHLLSRRSSNRGFLRPRPTFRPRTTIRCQKDLPRKIITLTLRTANIFGAHPARFDSASTSSSALSSRCARCWYPEDPPSLLRLSR
jgi:hypothetical protein